MSGADRSEGEEPQPVDSILYAASVAGPGSVPAASIWAAFLHGAAFGAGMLATFAAFCGALLAGDAARRRAVARARLKCALADLDAEDIVTLIQQQGNAELRRPAGRPGRRDRWHRETAGTVRRPGGTIAGDHEAVARAAPRAAWRPGNRQPPRKVPSRER